MDTPIKPCSLCKHPFPKTDEFFMRLKNGRFHSWCHECRRAKQRVANKKQYDMYPEKMLTIQKEKVKSGLTKAISKRYNDTHREQRREQGRIYREKYPDKARLKVRKSYEKHKDRRLKYARKYRVEHADEIKEYSNYYRQTHRHVCRLQGHKYRTLKRTLPFNITAEKWERAINYFNGCCAVCGRQMRDLFGTHRASMDHWVAITKGGGTTVDNIVPLCSGLGGCNTRKQDKDAEAWLIEVFGKRKAKQIMKRINQYFEWVKHEDAH